MAWNIILSHKSFYEKALSVCADVLKPHVDKMAEIAVPQIKQFKRESFSFSP